MGPYLLFFRNSINWRRNAKRRDTEASRHRSVRREISGRSSFLRQVSPATNQVFCFHKLVRIEAVESARSGGVGEKKSLVDQPVQRQFGASYAAMHLFLQQPPAGNSIKTFHKIRRLEEITEDRFRNFFPRNARRIVQFTLVPATDDIAIA